MFWLFHPPPLSLASEQALVTFLFPLGKVACLPTLTCCAQEPTVISEPSVLNEASWWSGKKLGFGIFKTWFIYLALPYGRHYSEHIIRINHWLLSATVQGGITPFHRWGDWGQEKWCRFLSVIQQAKAEPRFELSSWYSCSLPYSQDIRSLSCVATPQDSHLGSSALGPFLQQD